MHRRFVFEKQLELNSGAERRATRTTYVVMHVLRKPERKGIPPGLFKGLENFFEVLRETVYLEETLMVREIQNRKRPGGRFQGTALQSPGHGSKGMHFPRSTSQRP